MSNIRLVFPARGQVELREHAAPSPQAGQVRVTSTLSLMSTGTESIVLNGDFEPDTHFARFGKLPFLPGYLTVGIVDSVGNDVQNPRVGDRVFHRAGHGSRFTLQATDVTAIPDNVGDEAAVWAGLALIAYRAANAASFRIGARPLIVGAGPIGQMALRWAVLAGCDDVVVVSRSAFRLQWASAGGATHCIESPIESAAALIRCRLADPKIIVDATGNATVLEKLLPLASRYGTVVLLGDTGHPQRQRLTSDVMMKGLTVTAAHDRHDRLGGPASEVLPLVLGFMSRRQLDCTGLITHVFEPGRAADAYRLAQAERGQTMGIAFKWSAA